MTMEEAMELANAVFDEIISFQLVVNMFVTSFHSFSSLPSLTSGKAY